jgi:hypothetical protein
LLAVFHQPSAQYKNSARPPLSDSPEALGSANSVQGTQHGSSWCQVQDSGIRSVAWVVTDDQKLQANLPRKQREPPRWPQNNSDGRTAQAAPSGVPSLACLITKKQGRLAVLATRSRRQVWGAKTPLRGAVTADVVDLMTARSLAATPRTRAARKRQLPARKASCLPIPIRRSRLFRFLPQRLPRFGSHPSFKVPAVQQPTVSALAVRQAALGARCATPPFVVHSVTGWCDA